MTRSKVRVGEGEGQRIPLHGGRRMVGRQLPGLHHGRHGAAHLGHLLGSGIEGHHGRAAPSRLEGVSPESTPEVQEAIARPHAELVVVHRQHATSLPGAAAADGGGSRVGAPGSGFPSSTAS